MTSERRLFETQKAQTLAGVDLSRKGSIDAPIISLITHINLLSDYVTLSSCSGRICVFEEDPTGQTKKKGCRWLYTTHETCTSQNLKDALRDSIGDASVKFEPFVMHVQCCRLEDAQALHAEAVAAGFRNSGITVSRKGKVVVAVRSTHSMEIPCSRQGQTLVSERYLEYVAGLLNKKMGENLTRIDRLFQGLLKLGTRTTKDTHEEGNSRSASKAKAKDVESSKNHNSDSDSRREVYEFDIEDSCMNIFDT